MDAKLVVVGGEARVTEVDLQLPITLGRGRSSGLALPHPLVSRQHCEIYEEEGKLVVNDTGSLNGTFVGDQRISEPTFLMPGELLTVGTVTFRAVYEVEGEVDEDTDETTSADVPADDRTMQFNDQTLSDIAAEDVPDIDVEDSADVEELEKMQAVDEADDVGEVEEIEDLVFSDIEEVEEVEEVAEVDEVDEVDDVAFDTLKAQDVDVAEEVADEVEELEEVAEVDEVAESEEVGDSQPFDVAATLPAPTRPKPKASASNHSANAQGPPPKKAAAPTLAAADADLEDDEEAIPVDEAEHDTKEVDTSGDTEAAEADDDLQDFLRGLG